MSVSRVAALGQYTLLALSLSANAVHADIRLPDGIAPTFQSVTLRVDAREPRYSGTTSLAVTLDRPADEIQLHALVEVGEAWLTDGEGRWRLESREIDPEGLTALSAGRELPAGAYTLTIRFENEFDRTAVGLYRLDAEGHAYTFTQFEATEARKAFPCFDEPAFKIPFEVILEVPEGDVALANTPEVDRTELDGWVRVRFATTPPMPSYLVAVATGPFELVPVPGLDMPAHIVTPKGKAHLAASAVRQTKPILDELEAYFGRPYPYAKLDQIAVPEFWPGAMENAGLITYRESILLLDDARSTPGARKYQVEVMAHELAHQWFGNLVTMAWWDDLWLNESFATWMEKKVAHAILPDAGFDVDAVSEANAAMGTDALATTRAIRQPVENAADLLQSADILAYRKGQRVLGMFEQWVGPDAFRRGVRRYMDENEWGNATAGDLWAALSEEAGVDVGAAMSTFLDQPGAPLVHVHDLGRGRVRLEQERFHNHGTEVPPATWRVPLRIRFADAEGVHQRNVLLVDREMELQLTGGAELEWIHPNAGGSGYYRWTMAPELLAALTGSSAENLSLPERVGLRGDIDAMLVAGLVNGADYLRLVEAQARDPHPRVMDALVSSLSGLEDALVDEELRPAYESYMRDLLAPSVERYGIVPVAGESDHVANFRGDMLGALLDAGDPELSRALSEQGRAYLDDPDAVHPTLVGLSLRALCEGGDMALYEEIHGRFMAATTPADRSRFLYAHGYFGDPEILSRALDMSVGDEVRPQEVMSVAYAASSERANRDLIWNWMTGNYDAIMAKIPPPYAQYMAYFAMCCDEDDLARAEAFFADKIATTPAIGGELPKVVEQSVDCIRMREREGETVRRYLLEVRDLANRD